MGRSRCRSNCQGIYTLWFLKKLKRAGVPQSTTLFTITKQLSDLSWNMQARLTSEQSKTLEAVQQRACQIIIGGGTYSRNCSSLKLDSLLPVTGRQQQTKKTVQSDRQ